MSLAKREVNNDAVPLRIVTGSYDGGLGTTSAMSHRLVFLRSFGQLASLRGGWSKLGAWP